MRCASLVVVPGRSPASIAACLHQPRNVSALTPTRCPIRTTAAFSDSSGSSFLASATSRIARSRSSGGYFLGAGIGLILSGFQTLHETRGDSALQSGDARSADSSNYPREAERVSVGGPLLRLHVQLGGVLRGRGDACCGVR